MQAFVVLSRLLLVAVFGVAGIAKLLDLPGSRQAIIDFGGPRRLAPLLGLLLPIVELGLSAALLPAASARLGAAGTLTLLTVFLVVIARNLAAGRTPNCHCFGQLHSTPVSRSVVARNALLAAVAVFVLVAGWNDPGPTLVAWMFPLTAIQRAEVVGGALGLGMLCAQSALLLKLSRSSDQLSKQLAVSTSAPPALPGTPASPHPDAAAASPVGNLAPIFSLPNLDGTPTSLPSLWAAKRPVLLIFSDPECGPCGALLPKLARWQHDHGDALTIAVVSRGTVEANRAKMDAFGLRHVLLQRDREVAAAYDVVGTPSAILIRPDGTVGSPLAKGEAEIVQLVSETVRPMEQRAPAARTAAPDFSLQDLDGATVTLSQFRGKTTVVIFWSPSCGHCLGMLAALKAWESLPPIGRPRVLIVSTGGLEENRALGLTSSMVLDPEFEVARRFGVGGTPSAVRIDAEGFLASEVAAGAPDVFQLLGVSVSLQPGDEDACRSSGMTALPADAKPIKRAMVIDELLADSSVVLYNRCHNQIMSLNAMGAFVWESCDGEHDLDSIVSELRELFPHSTTLDNDVRALLDRLVESDMIGPAPIGESPVAVEHHVHA